jgi:hypothetical protein
MEVITAMQPTLPAAAAAAAVAGKASGGADVSGVVSCKHVWHGIRHNQSDDELECSRTRTFVLLPESSGNALPGMFALGKLAVKSSWSKHAGLVQPTASQISAASISTHQPDRCQPRHGC